MTSLFHYFQLFYTLNGPRHLFVGSVIRSSEFCALAQTDVRGLLGASLFFIFLAAWSIASA